jgi:Rv2258c-like winged HTH domain
MPVDENNLQQFMGKMVSDMGAAMGAALVYVGDRLGLYKAMAGAGPITSQELARRTGTDERYVREWLAGQAAAEYLKYDPATNRFMLSPEQELVFAVEGSPVFVPGAFEILMAVFADADKIIEAFKTGRGVGWHEHDPRLFSGTERFFRPGYAAHLISEWIRTRRGGRKTRTGCNGGRRRLRAWLVDNPDGKGFPEIAVYRLRLPPAIVGSSDAGDERGRIAQCTLRTGHGKRLPRFGL